MQQSIDTNARVDRSVSVRVFDTDGEPVPPRMGATIDYDVRPTSVRNLPDLPPGRSREFPLSVGWNLPGALPVGDYVFRATYANWAGSPELYDVHERGADEVWEGDLTASVGVSRSGTDFAFNATNTTRLVRKRWLDLFADYGARIRIIYVEPPIAEVRKQNRKRKEPVPEKVMEKLINSLEPPTIAEAHEVSLLTSAAT
jgi:hypothetical protein